MSKVTLFKTLKPCLNFQLPGMPDNPVNFINHRFATDVKEVEEGVRKLIGDSAFLIYIDENEPEVEFENFVSPRQRHAAMTQAYYGSGSTLQPSETLVGIPQAVVQATAASSVDMKGTKLGSTGQAPLKVSSNEAAAALKQQLLNAANAAKAQEATEKSGS